MKNLKHLLFVAFLLIFAFGCGDKRPKDGENFQISITGTSILHNAEVTLYSEGREIEKTATDETGAFEFKDVQTATGINIQVCKGLFSTVASENEVGFTGCLEHYIPASQEDVFVVVDFLSTFVTQYNEILEEKSLADADKSALEEWQEYLSMTTAPAPELQSSLTDATKRYLWQQGLSVLAWNVSKANNITPETMYSTENLFNLLVADLADDAVINGSGKVKFGSMDINALVLKNYIADAIPDVSDAFAAADLAEWTDGIRYSDARFLGGEGKGDRRSEIQITMDVYPEGNKGAHPSFYAGTITVEATAEPLELVKFVKCFAVYGDDGEDSITDNDDAENVFLGDYSTIGIENDSVVTVRCDASDGVSVKSAEMQITVNNDAPIITAVFFEKGTNIVTGTEENPAKGSVDLKAEASHAKFTVDEISCELEGYTMQNTATAKYQYTAAIDTTELPEGKNTLKCGVTMNQNHYAATFDFLVANTVSVAVKPYIVNALTDIKAVDIDCGNGFSGHYTTLENISLKRGNICRVTVSGGSFKSVTLSSSEDDPREYGGTISAVVIPQGNADIVVTPITTIQEIVYSSRLAAGEDATAALENSRNSIENHFSKAFTLTAEPKNTKQMDAATKYYIMLAGLENLAYFLEMQIAADHGAYSVSNILELLRDDYSDTVFDGAKNGSTLAFGTENKFELDSNFFRYYYATATKRFLQSDFNTTGQTNINSILNKISLNSDQYLFPAESEAIAIESDGPIIEIDSFRNLRAAKENDLENEDYTDGEFMAYVPNGDTVTYSNSKYPYFANAFILNFKLIPNNGNYIDLNSLEISEEDSGVFRYTRLSPAEIPGDGFTNEETEISFLIEYSDDGAGIERQIDFAVSVEDVAFNGNAVSVKSFLDSKAPIFNNIFMSEIAATTGADNFSIYYKVSDNALSEVGYCLYRTDTETDEITGEENTVETLIKCSVNTLDDAFEYDSTIEAARINTHLEEALDEGIISEKDGNYSVVISAVDRAGNTRSERRNFVFDTTPPEIPNMEFTNYEDAEYSGMGYYIIARTKLWHFVLSEPENDVYSWRVGVYCRRDFTPANYSDSAVNNYKTWAKTLGDYAATSDVADIELPSPQQGKFGVCVFYHEVCDLLANCNSSDGEALFFIDDEAPELVPINGSNYDVDLSVLTECTHNDNSGGGFVVLPNCVEAANCVKENGQLLIGSRQAQVLLKYTDNLFDPETGANLNVSITHNSRGWTRDCQYASGGGTCSKYWCDLSNSNNGSNSYTITASDGLNTSEPLVLNLNIATALDNPRPTLTKTFFTENSTSKLTWTETSGITYTCKIKKDGDSSFEKSCTNGGTISQGKGVNGSGKYQIVLRSTNGNGDYKDTTLGFTYFETKDLTVTFTPIAHQFLSNNGAFQFKTKVESSPAIAKITKIQYYLRGLYQNGSKVNDTEYLVKTLSLNSTSGQTEQVFSQNINLDAYGQFRNIRAKITFADGSTLVKDSNFSKEDSALYCKLGAVETLNNVQMNFDGDKLSVIYTKPSCITSSDYKLKAFIPAPSTCGGYSAYTTQPTFEENGTSGTSYNIFYGIELRTNNHTHTSGGVTEFSYCGAEFKAFSKDTTIRVTYNGGKTADAKGNLSWNNIPVSWSHKPHPKNCNKCNNLSTTVSCTQESTYSIDLKK